MVGCVLLGCLLPGLQGPETASGARARASLTAGSATFGQTQVGTLIDVGRANYLDASGPYNVASAISVSKLTAYVAGGSVSSKIRGVIYADNGGAPGAFVAVTPELTIPAEQAAAWVDLIFNSPVSLPAGSFWLGYWYADQNSKHYNLNVSNAERFAPALYSSTGNPPASFGTSSSSSSSYSLYATYATGGGSPPANTSLPTISGTAQQGQREKHSLAGDSMSHGEATSSRSCSCPASRKWQGFGLG